MNTKYLSIALAGTGAIAAISMAMCIITHYDNVMLRNAISEQQVGVLSPDEVRLILSDLESHNPRRIDPWALYFRHALDREASLHGRNPDVNTMFQLYKQREQPTRADYFNDLVLQLSRDHQAEKMSEQTALAYLGPPDETSKSGGTRILHYHYKSYGRESIAYLCMSNGWVATISFNLVPTPSQNGSNEIPAR